MINLILDKWLGKEDGPVGVAANPANAEISVLAMAKDKWWLSLLIILSFLAETAVVFCIKMET